MVSVSLLGLQQRLFGIILQIIVFVDPNNFWYSQREIEKWKTMKIRVLPFLEMPSSSRMLGQTWHISQWISPMDWWSWSAQQPCSPRGRRDGNCASLRQTQAEKQTTTPRAECFWWNTIITICIERWVWTFRENLKNMNYI